MIGSYRPQNHLAENLKARIVELLNRQPMTFAEMQMHADVSMPTLRRAVVELSETGWVETVGARTSTGGRPARLFGLNGDTHLIVGVHVEIPCVNIMLTALDGTVLEEVCYERSAGTLRPEDATRQIAEFVHSVWVRYPDRILLGIGMAAPGYVDAESGAILYVGRAPGWENYPMRARLQAAIGGLPIIMENDTDCLIRVEMDNADTRLANDAIYLGVLEGVKVSMLLNGQLYSGPFGNAGLVGRMRVMAPREDGTCESRELEDTTSVSGVCYRFDGRAAHWPEADEAVQRIATIGERTNKLRAILDAAEAGHPLCHEIISAMFEDLSLGVTNLIYVLQPTTLIVGGALSSLPEKLRDQFEASIRDKLPPLLSHHLIIRYARTTGRYAAATGAARLFLQRVTTTATAFEVQP